MFDIALFIKRFDAIGPKTLFVLVEFILFEFIAPALLFIFDAPFILLIPNLLDAPDTVLVSVLLNAFCELALTLFPVPFTPTLLLILDAPALALSAFIELFIVFAFVLLDAPVFTELDILLIALYPVIGETEPDTPLISDDILLFILLAFAVLRILAAPVICLSNAFVFCAWFAPDAEFTA